MKTYINKKGIARVFAPLFTFSVLLFSLSSCTSYFDPSTDDQIKENEYISSNTELYSGFIGIMTKMQAIGDKEILLTDTRAEFIEPTSNATTELVDIYNYKEGIEGNPYANPAGYYELIIACNDYLAKVKEYRKQPQVNQEICDNLISSTIRIKVWTYKTLGEIYGEAAWFDEPIGNVDQFMQSGYEVIPMDQIVARCLNLMENGYEGVSSDLVVDWIAWLDPANVTNIANSEFRKWNYMVPPYEGIYAELCLWNAAYLDAAGNNAAAKTYYKNAADALLKSLNTYIDNESNSGNNPYWIPNAGTAGRYQNLWLAQDPYAPENVSAILYDYANNQTHALAKHFNSDAPAEFLLGPSEAGMQNFTDKSINPGGSDGETRYKNLVGNSSLGKYIAKFRQNGGRNGIRSNAYQSDVHIYTYRATQYHLLLCEALNNLGRFEALDCTLNQGITGENQKTLLLADTATVDYPDQAAVEAARKEWEGFTRNWTTDASWGTRKYPGTGIRGAYSLSSRTIARQGEMTIAKAKRANDIAILKEVELELSCEGKTYPWMNRLAVRYSDLNIVADEVCPKYEATGKAEDIRSKILNGGNWVKYSLK